MKSIAPSLLLAYSTFTSATHVQLYPRYLNSTSSAVSNSTTPSNATFVPPPCFTITEMRKVIPSCALSCQTLALKADSCPYEDTACHCANTAAISAVVEPCLAASNCSASDVTAFAAIVMPTCAFLNATTDGTMPASCKLPVEEDDSDYDEPSSYDAPPPPPSTTSIPPKPVVTGYDSPAPPAVNTTIIPVKPVTTTTSTSYDNPTPPPPSPAKTTTTIPAKPVTTSIVYGYPAPPPPPAPAPAANTTTIPSKPVTTSTGYDHPAPPSNATTPSGTGYGYAAPTGYGYHSVSHKSTGMAMVPTKSGIGAPSSTPVPYAAGAASVGRSTGLVVFFSLLAVSASVLL
jgi:CFEM domain